MVACLASESVKMTERNDQLPTEIESAANHLLETWERLATSHQMIGGGCSCGAHAVVARLVDFEQDIGDHLRSEGERHQRRDVVELLDRSAREGDRWNVAKLLMNFTAPAVSGDTAAASFILDRLTRTVPSFEDLHRKR